MAYSESGVESKTEKKETVVERAKRCWKEVCDIEAPQRERELEDIKFQIPENQWPEKGYQDRKKAGRPTLSISLLRQPLQLIHNQAAAAQLGVDIHPVNETASAELAEIKQGIYRRIERDSNAEQARLWGLDRAEQCGRGWYRVNTQWDEDGDDPWDQEIVIERILHQESVYMDPSAQQPDFSDAEWAFVATWVPLDRFRREFPNAKIAKSDSDFSFGMQHEPDWVKTDSGKRAVLVVEYFYKHHEYVTVQDGDRKREMDKVTVKWCKLTGAEPEPLEEQDWNGRYIPLIPVIGIELQPINGERRWEGLVRPARDAQTAFNYAISSEVEDVARVSKTPYVGAVGQFEGHEDKWATANVKNYPYLEYNPIVDQVGRQPLPPPAPMQIDGSKMQLSMQLASEAKNLVQSATAIFDPSLGQVNTREKSGRHVLALQQQGEASTSHFTNNLAKITMRYEAMVVLDLMPKIYDRPGRVTRVLGGEDETKTVMLNQHFVKDAEGKPVPAEPNAPGAQIYDLTKGKYSLSVTIGKSQQTRLQEGAEEIGKILEAAPQLMTVIGPTYFRFRDFPGAKEIADILKEMREKEFPGLGQDKDGQATPDQLKAQLSAQAQQMQLVQAQLQQAMEAIKTDQAKQQAQIMKAQLDAQTKSQVAQIESQTELAIANQNNQTKLAIEKLAASVQALVEERKGADELLSRAEGQAHEVGLQETKLQHERLKQDKDHAHDVAMAAAGGNTMEFTREGGQESDQERSDERSEGSTEGRTMGRDEPEAKE
jgi:hypothetical protein